MMRYFRDRVPRGGQHTPQEINRMPERVHETSTGVSGTQISRIGDHAVIKSRAAIASGQTIFIGSFATPPPIPTAAMAIFYNTTDGQLWSAHADQAKWYPMQKYTTQTGAV